MTRHPERGGSWRHEILVQLPTRTGSPASSVLGRIVVAVAILVASAAVVYAARDGFQDTVNRAPLTLLDCLYFATVSITTTGFGDIVAVTPLARALSMLVLTPLRIVFLVLLVGTAVDVLATDRRRQAFRDMRWRSSMRAHTVVVGYGTKGRAAVRSLLENGIAASKVVVLDNRARAVQEANRAGLAAIEGDASKRETLERAEIAKARQVIITMDRDDAAILATLTVRQMNPTAQVVVAVQDQDNVALVRQSGATIVVTSSEAVGRLMGLSTVSTHLGRVVEDLLSSGEGIELAQRLVAPEEVGRGPAEIVGERVIAVVRRDKARRFFDASVQQLEVGDELIVVRRSENDKRAERQARLGSD